MKLLLIDNFDSFTYNIFQYCAQLGVTAKVIKNNEMSYDEIASEGYTHILISPGPGSPENSEDFGVCSEVIQKSPAKILGICLGHQGIAQTLGATIVRAPTPMHGKTSLVKLDITSPLFKGMNETIEVMRYHSLIIDEATLPKELKVIARTQQDNLIMGIAHTSRPLYGVQFHPESIGTPEGMTILDNFLHTI